MQVQFKASKFKAKGKPIEEPCLANHRVTVHIRSHKTPKVNF